MNLKKFLTLLFIPLASVALKAQCGMTLTFNVTDVNCPGACNGTATVMIAGYLGTSTFDWSPGTPVGDGTASVSGLCAGTYTVKVTDTLGCFQLANVEVIDTQTPSICMVTTDAQSVNNIVYWDKTLYNNVDSMLIYRDVASGTYARIGAVSVDSLSQFIDTTRSVGAAGANGDPNTSAYRYKIQIKHPCGSLSPMSLYHSTIHIIDAGSGDFAWAEHYQIEGLPNPVTSYILLCDTANVDVWTPVSSVPSTDTTANDPGFASHSSIANWRVKTAWPITCTPTRATINTTRSNIKHAALTTGIHFSTPENALLVYPNPAHDIFFIEYPATVKNGVIAVYNAMGQLVYQTETGETTQKISRKQLNISQYAPGIYSVVLTAESYKATRKLVVD